MVLIISRVVHSASKPLILLRELNYMLLVYGVECFLFSFSLLIRNWKDKGINDVFKCCVCSCKANKINYQGGNNISSEFVTAIEVYSSFCASLFASSNQMASSVIKINIGLDFDTFKA